MNNRGFKEFHPLFARNAVEPRNADGMVARFFGVQMAPIHRPPIESPSKADPRVRIYVTNRLPEPHNGTLHRGCDLGPRAWGRCPAGFSHPVFRRGKDLLSTEVRSAQIPAPSCITPMGIRWCRWRMGMMGMFVRPPQRPRDFMPGLIGDYP